MQWQWGESDKPVFLAIVETLPEAEGLADQFNNVGVMRQAIEEGGGKAVIPKELRPVGELEIGGNDHGGPFIEFGTEGKQGMSATGGKRDKAQFVQNDQILFLSQSNKPVKAVLFLSRQEFIHQPGRRPKSHAVILPTSRQGQRN